MPNTSQQMQIFTSENGQVQFGMTLQQDTFWLALSQMGELFATSTDNISLHLKNTYAEQELDETATTEDLSVVHNLLSNIGIYQVQGKGVSSDQQC